MSYLIRLRPLQHFQLKLKKKLAVTRKGRAITGPRGIYQEDSGNYVHPLR